MMMTMMMMLAVQDRGTSSLFASYIKQAYWYLQTSEAILL